MLKSGPSSADLPGREALRVADLLRMVPRGRSSLLDVGAQDGRLTKLLTRHFKTVTALDLERPSFEHPGVTTMAGNATRLPFADGSFDCVVCTEVLEHIRDVQAAARELVRVARYEILVGVPYRQDLRCGRAMCNKCGNAMPPWGHLHSFDERTLAALFPECKVAERSFVGTNKERTTAVAAWLMDLGGNPWGVYDQKEPCPYCGARLERPGRGPFWRRCCSAVAARMNAVQARITKKRPTWIHVLLIKLHAEEAAAPAFISGAGARCITAGLPMRSSAAGLQKNAAGG